MPPYMQVQTGTKVLGEAFVFCFIAQRWRTILCLEKRRIHEWRRGERGGRVGLLLGCGDTYSLL